MKAFEKIIQDGDSARAVLYARYSSDNQREESIIAQVRCMTEFCKRNGIAIVDKYIDRALTGTNDDRPQFQEMIADSSSGRFNLVIVHKIDRFSRNTEITYMYKYRLLENGVYLMGTDHPLDVDDPISVIYEAIENSRAQEYSMNLSKEVRKGLRENALKCMTTGGIAPLGFQYNAQKKLEIDPVESEAIKIIFSRTLEGVGYMDIVNELNSKGYKTKKGSSFSKTCLYDILRNEKYKGEYVYNRQVPHILGGKRNNHKQRNESEIIRIKNGCPAIISEEEFNKVQEILKSRRHMGARYNAKRVYLLAGKIICGECGASYTGNCKFSGRNKRELVTYRCSARQRKGGSACRNREINRDYLERFVLKRLSEMIFSDDLLKTYTEAYSKYIKELSIRNRPILDQMNKEYKLLCKKEKNLMDILAEEGNCGLFGKLKEIQAQKEALDIKRETEKQATLMKTLPEKELKASIKKARQMLSSGELPQTKHLIQLYVNSVIVGADEVRVIFNPMPELKEIEVIQGFLDYVSAMYPSSMSTAEIKRKELYMQERKVS